MNSSNPSENRMVSQWEVQKSLMGQAQAPAFHCSKKGVPKVHFYRMKSKRVKTVLPLGVPGRKMVKLNTFAFNLEVNRSCWRIGLRGAELMEMQFPLHQPETVVLQVPLWLLFKVFSVASSIWKDASKPGLNSSPSFRNCISSFSSAIGNQKRYRVIRNYKPEGTIWNKASLNLLKALLHAKCLLFF